MGYFLEPRHLQSDRRHHDLPNGGLQRVELIAFLIFKIRKIENEILELEKQLSTKKMALAIRKAEES